MLGDCKPKAFLKYTAKNIDLPNEFDVIDLNLESDIWKGNSENPALVNKPGDAAYCIYTSGTSGEPKGVIIENHSVVNHLNVTRNKFYAKNGNAATPLFTSFAFDFVVPTIFGTLLFGDTLAVTNDVQSLALYAENNPLAVLKITPSYFNSSYDCFNNHKGKVSTIVFGGETLTAETIGHVRQVFGDDIRIFNEYGPTETTVFTSTAEIHSSDTIVTIGKPVENSRIYMFNGEKLCGIGEPGELCIVGDGVARGYLNRPELTDEKFVKNPFGEGRMYRSGDLARWLPDGNIEYLGRIDEQVKIRGLRIELGEIESRMREIPEISDCAVIVKTDESGEKAICAYYVSSQQLSIADIKLRLGEKLPVYMIPSYMMQIDAVPLTRNGKTDKKALPDIDIRTLREYVAPRTPTEKIICDIFAEVLYVEKVGANDNFFELGGHSLRATRLVNSIEEKTGAKISLKEVFVNSTPEQLAVIVDGSTAEAYQPIPKAEEKEYYSMSSVQKRLFLVQQMVPDMTAYNMPFAIGFGKNFNGEKFELALNKLLSRNEILRTSFALVNDEPVQIIHPTAKVEINRVKLSNSYDLNSAYNDFIKPFDLSKAPLLRVSLVENEDGETTAFFDIHHIISDGFSSSLMETEFVRLYNGEELEEKTCQYKDYSERMNARDFSSQKQYWLEQFEDDVPVLNLPLDYPRGSTQSFNGSEMIVTLGKQRSQKVHALMKEKGITDYMLFLSALMITLGKSAGQEDVVVGSAISGRTHKDTENMLGMFVNTIAMRGKPEKNKTIDEFLNEIKTLSLNAYDNQDYPFEDLIDNLNIERDMARNPLFDVMFTVQNNENTKESFDDVEAENAEVTVNSKNAKFDLTFTITGCEDDYVVSLVYCSDLFSRENMDYLCRHYLEIVDIICADTSKKIADAGCFTEEEKNRILCDFNNTSTNYPKDKTVVDLFEEQVEKTPDNIAVVFGGERLTYAQLNQRANAIAYDLREIGVEPDDLVVILADKSCEMLAGIQGILKAGGAYLPIDPTYPEDRISFLLEDSRPKAVLKHTTENVAVPAEIPVLELGEYKNIEGFFKNPERVNKPTDAVYCIYTSGTTGKPKGVIVEHHNVVQLVKNCSYLDLNENMVMLQTGQLIFDASTFEIWGSALNGGTLHLVSKETLLDTQWLKKYITDNKINTMFITTALLNQFISDDVSVFDGLDHVQFGGEAASEKQVTKLIRHNKHLDLRNFYGPTETTTYATYCPVDREFTKIPIGKPISNAQIYILNGMQLCGIGVPGELCIAGDGVARGYLNRPELTNEKFVDNPFGKGRIYRSGDLARWLPDGNIEYLGRIDQQVKIRGFRIELGEIESKIKDISGIKDCVVIAKEDSSGDKAMYAYYTAEKEISPADIKTRLQDSLPEYMIPSYMMQLSELPMTRGGKLDKKNLPDIVSESSAEYVAPRDDFERKICDIFGSVLGIKRVGLDDNFYNLGGDSIKAVRIVSKMRENGYKILVSDIMKYKTIGKCLSCITKTAGDVVYEQGEVTGVVGKTPILKYFESLRLAEPQHFNQSKVIDVMQADNDTLKKVLTSIVINHDMLRAVYRNGQAEILSSSESKMFDFYDLGDFTNIPLEKVSEKCTEIQASINLEEGPLVKAVVFTENGHKLLVLIIHHLAVDIMSWKILTEDFESAYKALSEGRELVYPPKTASYIEWAKALEDYKKSEDFAKNEAYWKKAADGIENYGFNSLKKEFAHPYSMLEEVFVVSKEEVLNLKESAEVFNASVLEMLFSALALAVNMISEQEKLTVAVETHGRETLHKEIMIDRTVGWFTTVYPVLLECTSDIRTLIVNNKEILRGIPKNGFDYGLIDKPEIDDSDFICFNYAGETVANEDDGGSGVSEEQTQSNMPVISGEPFSKKNIMKNNIVFNVSLQNGVLRVNIQYNSEFYSKNEIEILFENFRRALNDISDYCLSMDDSVFTASDFDSSMDNDDFENLLDLI